MLLMLLGVLLCWSAAVAASARTGKAEAARCALAWRPTAIVTGSANGRGVCD
jgi:hypothetical protein